MSESASTAFTDHMARKKLAERGKSAEKIVEGYFAKRKAHLGVGFDFERVPDARAAGGRFTPVTGDFRAFYLGKSSNIEVKEADTVDLLPKKNFSRDKIARCYRRSLTGVITVVLIHHTRTDSWVIAPISHFFENDVPSWRTNAFPNFKTADAALDFGLYPLFNA